MEIICTQENLSKGLTIVSKLVSQNINLPILNNILFETKEGQLRLASTNLETGINCFIGGKIIKTGCITIPASLITNYINSLPEERIALKIKEDILQIKTKYNQAVIKGLPAVDFPFQYKLITKMKKGASLKVQEGELKQGLARTSFAAAWDELRPEIAGVLFRFSQNKLTLVATDSYRLAERRIKLEKEASRNFEVIVPIKAVQGLIYILEDTDEIVKIFFYEGQALFQVRNLDFTTRLVEGQYPDYKQIIPQNFSTQVKVKSNDLSQAIKRASLFSARETSDIKLLIDSKKSEILVFAETSQAGHNKSSVQAEVQGETQEIVYNYRYFLEGLANILGEGVIFETNGQEEPGLLKPESKEDPFLYLIMPIRG